MSAHAPENILPLEPATRLAPRAERRIGALLLEEGKLDADQLERVLEAQRAQGVPFGEAALQLGYIAASDLRHALARQYHYAYLVPGRAGASLELVCAYAPFHRRAEEMRALRTQLLIHWFRPDAGRKTLAVVSPAVGEGKSYVAANLAVAFAQLGQPTLLIDADLRTPRQHRIFSVASSGGLSALLAGRGEEDATVPVPGFNTLSLLPAGALPPNPQELLSRPAFDALLAQMQAQFGVILIDTPAAQPYADAQNIAYRAGDALMVTRKDHTRLAAADKTMRDLTDAGARLVGTVMNAF